MSKVLSARPYATAGEARAALGAIAPLTWLLSRRLWALPVLTFLAGPVVMLSMHLWFRYSGLLEGRELLTYASATVGDWILLPILVLLAALTMRDLGSLGLGKLGPRMRWLPALIAVVGTTSLHALWFNDAGNANWTQPIGHSPFGQPLWFNSAGVAHALFFLVMQWWVAEFVLRLVVAIPRLRSSSSVPVAADADSVAAVSRILVWVNAALVTSLGFGFLVAIDYRWRFSSPSASQTWVWLIIPVVVVAVAAVSNTVLLGWLGRALQPVSAECDHASDENCAAVESAAVMNTEFHPDIERAERTAILLWAVPLSAIGVEVSALTSAFVVERIGLLVGVCIALAILGPVNVWAETYLFQLRRSIDWVGWWAMGSIGVTMLGGFFLSLRMILSLGAVGSLGEIVGPWIVAFSVAMVASCGAAGLGAMLAVREAHNPEWAHARHLWGCDGEHFGQETPEHDITQNVSQYGLLHGLLTMFGAAYVVLAQPLLVDALDTGSQVSLLFGYAGIVVAAVTFSLYNNMEYVRTLEEQLKVERESTASRQAVIEYIKADKAFSMALSIAIGVIAAMGAMWMWIAILDSILSHA